MIGIYGILCLENGKVYIGQSQEIFKRWKAHTRKLNKNQHCNKHLQYAWNKYGSGAFLFGVCQESSSESLDLLEEAWIGKMVSNEKDKGFNSSAYPCGRRGVKLTEETRRKISISRMGKTPPNKGVPHSEESKRKMSQNRMGINPPKSQEWIDRVAASHRGKKRSEEAKLRMSEAMKRNGKLRSENMKGWKPMTDPEGKHRRVTAPEISSRLSEGWILGWV